MKKIIAGIFLFVAFLGFGSIAPKEVKAVNACYQCKCWWKGAEICGVHAITNINGCDNSFCRQGTVTTNSCLKWAQDKGGTSGDIYADTGSNPQTGTNVGDYTADCGNNCTDSCVNGGGGGPPPGSSCGLPSKTPVNPVSDTCANCVIPQMRSQIDFVKSQGNTQCTDRETLSHLCNGGIGDNASTCTQIQQGVCATSCSGGSGYGFYCYDDHTIWVENSTGTRNSYCTCSPGSSQGDCQGNTCRAKPPTAPYSRDAECYTSTATISPTLTPTPSAIIISGKVTDQNGQGIAGVVINDDSVASVTNHPSWTQNCNIGKTTTDSKGNFQFNTTTGATFCLRLPKLTGYTGPSTSYECQTAGTYASPDNCGRNPGSDQIVDNAYNFTYTAIVPKTSFYRISDKIFQSGDTAPEWLPYTDEPMAFDYLFKNAKIGDTLTIFVQFQADNGEKSAIFQKSIKYIGSDPKISSISCQYDPSGFGTSIIINGTNLGNIQGKGTVKLPAENLDANILSWGEVASSPTVSSTPTPTSSPSFTAPTCSVALNASTFTNGVDTMLSAVADGHGKNPKQVGIYMKNAAEVNKITSEDIFPIKSTNCDDTTSTCILNAHYTFNKAAGNYILSCNAYYDTLPNNNDKNYQCTGNLTRLANTIVMPPWSDCGGNSRKNITITSTSSAQVLLNNNVLAASVAESKIAAKVDTKLTEGRHTIQVTTDDGRIVTGTCNIGLTAVDFIQKTSCLGISADLSKDNVAVDITEKAEKAKPVITKKIKIDKDGRPVDLTPSLEIGKTYVLTIKAPKTVSRKIEFTAEQGTTNLSDIILPVGDIYPVASPDNKINAFDKAEMSREWNLIGDVTRPADLNNDSRVNSVDYSCLQNNYNASGD